MTRAAFGSLTVAYGDGTSVPALEFAGVATGYYDTYSQTFATTPGLTYAYAFTFNNSYDNAPSGLLVTATATAPGPTPGAGVLGLASLVLAGLYARTRRA